MKPYNKSWRYNKGTYKIKYAKVPTSEKGRNLAKFLGFRLSKSKKFMYRRDYFKE